MTQTGADYTGPLFTNELGPCIAGAVDPTTTGVYTIGAELPAAMFVKTVYANRMEGIYLRVYGGFAGGSEEKLSVISLPGIGRAYRPQLTAMGNQRCRDVGTPEADPVPDWNRRGRSSIRAHHQLVRVRVPRHAATVVGRGPDAG